ncbi:hypothetical protein M406DRAFT_103246, partial [Cryphonectria parasitica EP155]
VERHKGPFSSIISLQFPPLSKRSGFLRWNTQLSDPSFFFFLSILILDLFHFIISFLSLYLVGFLWHSKN